MRNQKCQLQLKLLTKNCNIARNSQYYKSNESLFFAQKSNKDCIIIANLNQQL